MSLPLMPIAPATEYLEKVRSFLDTDQLARSLGGKGRIYRIQDDFTRPEDQDTKPWGRVVLVPTTRLWGDEPEPVPFRQVSFLVRAEVNDFVSSGYNPSYILEGVHLKVNALLVQYAPTLDSAVVAIPTYLHTPPSTGPLWDESRRLWIMSAEYRCELAVKQPA